MNTCIHHKHPHTYIPTPYTYQHTYQITFFKSHKDTHRHQYMHSYTQPSLIILINTHLFYKT